MRALDAALPRGGLPLGAITEIVSDGAGVGAMSLAMRIAARCGWSMDDGRWEETAPPASTHHRPSTIDHPWVVFVDTHGDLYPPALVTFGLSMERLIVVRPRREKDALWATDQALRCSAVAVVIAPLRRLDERASRRLQLAAESSGVLGLILRPACDRVKTFAAVRLLIEAVGAVRTGGSHRERCAKPGGGLSVDAVRLCRITLLKVREGRPVEPIPVDLHHETGDGPLPSVLGNRSTATG